LASFVEEANALAGLYHPNVANIIDRGVSGGIPFLVLEYLIGADLKQYATAKPMSLFELRQVVVESCAGLAALHGAGLVHRDIKPANLYLRLPLAGGERFEGDKHRDPARAQPLSTVVIDFGMVRAIRVPAEVGGRFVAEPPARPGAARRNRRALRNLRRASLSVSGRRSSCNSSLMPSPPRRAAQASTSLLTTPRSRSKTPICFIRRR